MRMPNVAMKSKRILVVDDDPENLNFLTQFLAAEGHSVTHAAEAEGALHRIRAWKPHIILLDVNMPGISGLELIPKIRAATADDYVSIMLVSANMSIDDVRKGMDAGADDYLTKPFRAQEVLARVQLMLRLKDLQDTVRRVNHRIEELSNTDELTGLMNMRAFYRKAEDEILKCRRFRKPASVLIINIDQFALVNNKTDFLFGNKILKDVGMRIRECIRSMDSLARIGADEFIVFLSETDLAGAEFMAERIRDSIQKSEIKGDRHSVRLTACVGVAGFSEEVMEGAFAGLFRNAHEALRSAKLGGQNQTEIYSFV